MSEIGFFQGTPVSSTNKTDRHDIAEILLKVTLSTINQNQTLDKWRHQFSIYTYFLFQNIITVCCVVPKAVTISFFQTNMNLILIWIWTKRLTQSSTITSVTNELRVMSIRNSIIAVWISFKTFKWIPNCQSFRFPLSECKYFYNHS